ncbi:variable large family protein, partial [Borreliella valaisiana]|uniref:variable large family protein n=2 Tax=Borreliella valaisiana TaxID=62088 RepID=UPI001B34D607
MKDATNPIDAAIGSKGAGQNAAADAFKNNGMMKDDQIAAAGGKDNANAGKLFAKRQHAGAHGGGAAADADKAAAAVSAVSGEQILKAIVDAAKDGKDKTGVNDVKDATNPIDAAIGSTGAEQDAAAFANGGMTKDDQIAAAMVLRGMAQGGQFALTNGDHANAKGTVKNAVEMAKAAAAAASAATGGGNEAIGSVV